VIKELSHVLLVSNHHNTKGHGQLRGGFILQNFFGLGPTEIELLLKVTNFGLPDSLSALLPHLPEREPVRLSMRVPSLLTNAILEVE
jgi:hypothetical protein